MLEADFAEPAENELIGQHFTILSLTALTVVGIWPDWLSPLSQFPLAATSADWSRPAAEPLCLSPISSYWNAKPI